MNRFFSSSRVWLLCLLALGSRASAQETAPAPGPLQGLVVVDEPSEVSEAGRPGVRGVDVAQAGPFADPALTTRLQGLIGRPLNTELLPAVRQAVADYYADNQALLVRVILPVQEVRDGVLQILLVRSRIGQLSLEGERWFSARDYRDALAVQPGEELDITRLNAGVDRINANPFRRAKIELSPGDELGVTNLTLRATDRIPLTFTAGYSDSGTISTGRDRVNAGVTWGNAFGRGDTFSYNFGASPGSNALRSHAVGYSATLPWAHRVSLNASYGDMHSILPEPFDQRGESAAAALRYELNLPAWGRVRHALAFGADYKRSDSNLLFSAIPVFGSLTEVVQGSVDYSGVIIDRAGGTNFQLRFVGSPGGLAAHNETADFRLQRADASARYAYASLSLSRRTRLPANLAWTSAVTGQLTTDNLLGSEQMALGGAYSMRGYEEGEVYADQGLTLRNEVHLPPWIYGNERWRSQITPLVFWDYGYGLVKKALPGERERYSLSSVGAGLRLNVSRHASVSFDYGWQLIQTGLNSYQRTNRGHLNANLSW